MIELMNKTLFKFFCLLTFFLGFFSKSIYAEKYQSIILKGNERLSYETVIMFSNLDINSDIDQNQLNEVIKKLYQTNYFKDVKIFSDNKNLIIEVIENPIIQSIKITGVKNKELLKRLNDITKKSEKYPFLLNNVNKEKNFLLNTVRANGFYFSELKVNIIRNENNSIEIFYNFDLGERAIIKKINFNGNNVFKDSKLRNIIKSEEGKFWKIITSNKYLDERRVELDESLLKRYYENKGFYNVKIKSTFAKNINNQYFDLNFNISEGKKFFFKNVSIQLDDKFKPENVKKINKLIKKLNGEQFSRKTLNDVSKKIDKISIKEEYVFLNTKYNLVILENNQLNVEFIFENIEKTYIDQINVFGNFITEEKVIRNSLIVDEGDAFNELLFKRSIDKIKSKRIFRSIKSEIKTANFDKQKKIIDITVEEKPTGEIFAGAGTGTSGATITAGITESNYAGKGIKLLTNLSLSENEIKGKFSVVNPNFKNSDRSLNTVLESTSSDFLNTGGFKTSRTGFSIGTGFQQYDDFFINIDLSTYYEKLETSSTASDYKKKQEGDYLENLFTYNLTLNKLDQNFQPSDGYKINLKQVLPLYSDDLSIENTLNLSKYHSISDNLILSGKFFFKSVNSIDDHARVSRRVYIPSSKLRGFEAGRFGPKDGDEYVGGNFGSAVNFNTTLPNILSENENVDLSLFLDAAALWEVDYDSSLESRKIRSATGVSVNWFTVIGPLSFSYAIPLSSEPSDNTESFRFRIGTSF
ncbi:MAG: outer membrane protein assembly factor BamA [Candidatus Pelagibacter sp.]|nr:outer membrane protein assembly factor BamA [Candidatus Pelagibacter sp.]